MLYVNELLCNILENVENAQCTHGFSGFRFFCDFHGITEVTLILANIGTKLFNNVKPSLEIVLYYVSP